MLPMSIPFPRSVPHWLAETPLSHYDRPVGHSLSCSNPTPGQRPEFGIISRIQHVGSFRSMTAACLRRHDGYPITFSGVCGWRPAREAKRWKHPAAPIPESSHRHERLQSKTMRMAFMDLSDDGTSLAKTGYCNADKQPPLLSLSGCQ